jgi:hypothetical protein
VKTLHDWVMEQPLIRHFLVRRAGSNIETRWRVAVWEKTEGEGWNSLIGEAYGEDLEQVSLSAIANLALRKSAAHARPRAWYLPFGLTDGRPLD